jgi:hypothetical protein
MNYREKSRSDHPIPQYLLAKNNKKCRSAGVSKQTKATKPSEYSAHEARMQRIRRAKESNATQHQKLNYRSKEHLPYKTESLEGHGAMGTSDMGKRNGDEQMDHAMMGQKKGDGKALKKDTILVPLYSQR